METGALVGLVNFNLHVASEEAGGEIIYAAAAVVVVASTAGGGSQRYYRAHPDNVTALSLDAARARCASGHVGRSPEVLGREPV